MDTKMIEEIKILVAAELIEFIRSTSDKNLKVLYESVLKSNFLIKAITSIFGSSVSFGFTAPRKEMIKFLEDKVLNSSTRDKTLNTALKSGYAPSDKTISVIGLL